MCQFCYAMERMKANIGEDTYNAGAESLSDLMDSHFSKQRAVETVGHMLSEEKLDVPHDIALKIFREGIVAGNVVNAHMVFGLCQEQTGMLRALHERAAKMANEFKDTPTVMQHLGEIVGITTHFARNEAEAAISTLLHMGSDMGVRPELIVGEATQDGMIDEEYAMIGERCKARHRARYAAIVVLLGLQRIEPTLPQVGRTLVDSLIKSFADLKALADKYVNGGDLTFVTRAAQTVRS